MNCLVGSINYNFVNFKFRLPNSLSKNFLFSVLYFRNTQWNTSFIVMKSIIYMYINLKKMNKKRVNKQIEFICGLYIRIF